MKAAIPPYQFRQNLIHALSTRRGLGEELHDLKNSLFVEHAMPAIEVLIKRIPKFEELIFGHSFPEESKDLGLCPSGFYRPKLFFNELRWVSLQVLRNKNKIKSYINYRDQIEHHILLGNYTLALELLENCRKTLGYSIWYYEMKLVVYGLKKDNEKMIELISEVNTIHKDAKKGYVSLLIHFLYKRSMDSMSALDFDMELESIFKRNSKEYLKDRDNYFLYRLNFFNNIHVGDKSPYLLFESINSLIDRYRLLAQLIKTAFFDKEMDRVGVVELGALLYKKVKDPDLLPLVAINKGNLPENYYYEEFIQALDFYYTGKYLQVIELCRRAIKTHPSDLDFIKLYCHSLILAHKGFIPISKDVEIPVNQIAHLIYLIKNGDNIQENTYKLYQFSKRLYGFSIAANLDNFYKREMDLQDNPNLHLMYKRTFDPYFVNLLTSEEEKLDYLDSATGYLSDSIVIRYQKHRIQNIIDDSDGVVDYISGLNNAAILANQKKYTESNQLLDDLTYKYRECVPVVQSAVNLSFSNFAMQENYQGAIQYYVRKYLENKAYVAKVITKDFVRQLNRRRYKDLRYNLDFLVFAVLNIHEESDLSFLLESYCDYLGVKPISGLLDSLETVDPLRVEVFLSQIVQDDFLRHTTFVESTREVLDQLQQIIQYLIKMETSSQALYLKWQQELSEEMIAYEGMRKVDESKIYANQAAIIKYELGDIRRLYEQYGTQNMFGRYGNVVCLVDTIQHHSDDQAKNVWANGVHFTDNSLKEISYQLYDRIRYKFLKSKFGLGTYLSTRIRHGVFEGQIRAVFDEAHLVLNTENERYVQNHYWHNRFALTNEEQSKLMDELEKLSQKVDFAISSFKSKVLQIKLKESEDGEFNYIVSDDKICLDVLRAYRESNSFESFCDKLMYTLWEVTSVNLTNIRNIINDRFINTLRQALDDLQPIVEKISGSRFSNEFIRSLGDCRSNLERKITSVSEWFYIQDAKFDDFNFYSQFNIVWDVTRKMHPSVVCTLECSCVETLYIKGEYCIHISDLLRIFISNMMKHSRSQPSRKFKMNASVEDGILTIIFENQFNGDSHEMKARITQLLSSDERLQKENGSGLVKARKIVRYDLGCLDNDVIVDIADGVYRSIITIHLNNLIANGQKENSLN